MDQLKAARMCSTPLLAITALDQAAVARQITESLNGNTPVVSWDRVQGILPRNASGKAALKQFCKDTGMGADELPVVTAEAHNAFRHALALPAHTVLIAFSLNRFLREEQAAQTVQCILNLRDPFKGDQRTFIGLSPDFSLPIEIQHDVIMLDDPLPTDEQYADVVNELHEDAIEKKAPKALVKEAVRSVRGLSTFEAEQVIAMSIASTNMTSLDLSSAWKLKVGSVAKVKGLTMTLDGPDLADLRGLDNITLALNDLWDGPEPPELVVRIDEIDKTMAGLAGDSTGVTQDLNKNFLTNMEDYGWIGAILVGLRGSGKTVLTESIGVAHNVPTIALDAGAMKGKHVGESEQAFRDAFRTIKSIGGSRVLVLATCNKLEVMPPELLRRFKMGIFYFDLLTKEERASLWPVYLKKYAHNLQSKLPDDEGWTGAEIRNCCEMAYKRNKTVFEIGATSIVPVTKSDKAGVESLRNQAETMAFLSASREGAYTREVEEVQATVTRKMRR
jgi:hypothetical protein